MRLNKGMERFTWVFHHEGHEGFEIQMLVNVSVGNS
jgi:hypothetical protein